LVPFEKDFFGLKVVFLSPLERSEQEDEASYKIFFIRLCVFYCGKRDAAVGGGAKPPATPHTTSGLGGDMGGSNFLIFRSDLLFITGTFVSIS
jgi:hypothetical protein